ncbi:MAG: tyrosine-protein phosphatase [Bacteriovoracaceae bacterium]
MKKIFSGITILLCSKLYAYGELISPIPSTFLEVSTPNTHIVDKTESSYILRGSTPKNKDDIQSLITFGVKKIIILKNQTRNEVDEEIKDIQSLGFEKNNIIHLPLKWRDFFLLKTQCELSLQALKEIKAALELKQSLYFHCTVGEDRTGHLSALWKFYRNPTHSAEELFLSEMCAYGFEAKNPNKPMKNVNDIRAFLTPLYFRMIDFLKRELSQGKTLEEMVCPDEEFYPDYHMLRVCP